MQLQRSCHHCTLSGGQEVFINSITAVGRGGKAVSVLNDDDTITVCVTLVMAHVVNDEFAAKHVWEVLATIKVKRIES